MTSDQAQTLHTIALAAAMLGVAETLLGLIFSRAKKPQNKNLSYMLLFAGPGFLVAAAILYWGTEYLPTVIAAVVAVAVGCNVGAFRMIRATKETAGDQLQ